MRATSHRVALADSVTLDQLEGERFVVPRAQWTIWDVVDSAFRLAGLTRRIAESRVVVSPTT